MRDDDRVHGIQDAQSAPCALDEKAAAHVVFVGLASCFGCQINITNIESHLLGVLDQVDVRYWQLTSSDPMPEDFDIAVIEGAVTTEDSERVVRQVRQVADVVITIGACAATAGIPGMASRAFEDRPADVYVSGVPAACGDMIAPRPVKSVIDVDFEVPCCPADPLMFVDVLHRVLCGSNKTRLTSTLCGECKRNERGCFYERGIMCLGLVTRSGCGARCPNLGRPCNGCAGLSPDANLESARAACAQAGIPVGRFDVALELFNQRVLVEAEDTAENRTCPEAADGQGGQVERDAGQKGGA